MQPIILYDVYVESGVPPAPNPWVARLCLKHKGVPFVVKKLTFQELRSRAPGSLFDRLSPILGPNDRPLIPMIEIPSDQGSVLLGDNMAIAEYLDAAFQPPQYPSLFFPDGTAEDMDPNSPAFQMAHSTARILKEGIGNSDSMWSAFFELTVDSMSELYDEASKAFLRSDEKLGMGTNSYDKFMRMNRADLLAQTRRSLLPFEGILTPRPSIRVVGGNVDLLRPDDTTQPAFLSGSKSRPGLVDFILFGRFAMVYIADRQLSEAIFGESSDAAKAWVKREEERRQAAGLACEDTGTWLGDIALPGIAAWVKRVSSLHSTHLCQ